MPLVQGLDHVIVLVRDLALAREGFTRLGFKITPQALHTEVMGTANATAMFRNGTYVELLTVLNETPLNQALARRLEVREGLAGVAWKTSDARATAAAFREAGLGAADPEDFSRPVDLEQDTRDARFTIARLDPAATPAAWMFACQHHTPELVWREGYLVHPNGASGLLEVVGVAADLGAIERAYAPLVGRAGICREEDRVVVLSAGEVSVTFLAPIAFCERFGRTPRAPLPNLGALAVRSDDLDRVRAALEQHAVPHLADTRRVLVPREAACGMALEFVASSS